NKEESSFLKQTLSGDLKKKAPDIPSVCPGPHQNIKSAKNVTERNNNFSSCFIPVVIGNNTIPYIAKRAKRGIPFVTPGRTVIQWRVD
ncbi:TPA: hypothetical protein ACOEOY_004537, partial [Enterobacter ludwigii]